jgi:hypothetical protein
MDDDQGNLKAKQRVAKDNANAPFNLSVRTFVTESATETGIFPGLYPGGGADCFLCLLPLERPGFLCAGDDNTGIDDGCKGDAEVAAAAAAAAAIAGVG